MNFDKGSKFRGKCWGRWGIGFWVGVEQGNLASQPAVVNPQGLAGGYALKIFTGTSGCDLRVFKMSTMAPGLLISIHDNRHILKNISMLSPITFISASEWKDVDMDS